MKKYISTLVFVALFFLVISSVAAAASVPVPGSFTLKVGESVLVTNYQSMTIKLNQIKTISTLSYPGKISYVAAITASSPGGCGPNADPRCLGAPGFSSDYDISAGNTVAVLGLNIKAVSVSSSSAQFEVSLKDAGVSQCAQRPPCLDATPRCMIAEPAEGWCPSPGPEPTPIPVDAGSGGGLIICSNGGTDCSTQPASSGGGSATASPAVTVNLSEGEFTQSVEKAPDDTNTTETYTLITEKKAHLFFIIPVYVPFTYSVNAETGEKTVVHKPWWNFLAW